MGAFSDAMANEGIGGIPSYIYERIVANPMWAGKPPHIANPLITTQIALENPDRWPIIPGIVTGMIGWIMKYAGEAIDGKGIQGTVSKFAAGIGSAMMGFGFTEAAVALPASWLFLAPYNEAGGSTGHTQAIGFTGGTGTQASSGAVNTVWTVRGAGQIRNSTGPVDVYPT